MLISLHSFSSYIEFSCFETQSLRVYIHSSQLEIASSCWEITHG